MVRDNGSFVYAPYLTTLSPGALSTTYRFAMAGYGAKPNLKQGFLPVGIRVRHYAE